MIFTILQKKIKVTTANIFYLIYFVCLQLWGKKKLLSPQFKTFSFSILLQNVLDMGRKVSACGLKVALLKMLQTILKAGGAQDNILEKWREKRWEQTERTVETPHRQLLPPEVKTWWRGQKSKGSGGGKRRKISRMRGGRVMAKLGPLCSC